ncbi:hypothetical protein WL29_21430 [Burkholderia ubonensis]|uniref:Uncharacterized protein n=1 Tax=Burkholderia ubonensis TaxID=101571 RepID=A0A106QBQ5_9BURK|nr:class I SAM-dependent methyltransferase [Burkholderia ubonensis]KWA83931.1 hypothetical protein WL29_21430 [Burkholderia ubonensis]
MKNNSYDAANLEAMGEAVGYQAAMRQLVFDKLRLRTARGRVLDFGAGRGDYAAAIQRCTASQVLCLEPDRTLHQHYPSGMSVVDDLNRIEASSLDGAYSLNVLEHIEDDIGALTELAARCRPGALVFVLVPANPRLWTPMDTLVGHYRRYTPRLLRESARLAGLEVVEEGWFDRTGYFATRAYQRLHRAGLLRAQSAGAVSRQQIRCFDALFKLSEPVLRNLRLPFGKNCWVLARRP